MPARRKLLAGLGELLGWVGARGIGIRSARGIGVRATWRWVRVAAALWVAAALRLAAALWVAAALRLAAPIWALAIGIRPVGILTEGTARRRSRHCRTTLT